MLAELFLDRKVISEYILLETDITDLVLVLILTSCKNLLRKFTLLFLSELFETRIASLLLHCVARANQIGQPKKIC
jgi:hypothetical protein